MALARGVFQQPANAARLLEEIPNKVRDLLGMVVPIKLHHEAGRDWLEIVVEPYPSAISDRATKNFGQNCGENFGQNAGRNSLIFGRITHP
jgi:hypothetical protein